MTTSDADLGAAGRSAAELDAGAFPKRVSLRDGRVVVLRRSTLNDAAGIWRLNAAIVSDGRGVVLLPEELAPDPGPIRTQLEWWVSHPDSLHVVADLDGRVVGSVDIRRIHRLQMMHVGTLTMGVHPEAQGQGLGREMLMATLSWAQGHGLLRVELFVLADNDRAIALYRSAGFVETHRRTRFLRRPDGTWGDDLGMAWTPRGDGARFS